MRWLADENFNNDIVRGLRRRLPNVDLVRAQEVGLSGVSDPVLLQWAAIENRIVMTHDVSTITAFAYERVVRGLQMPGVVEVRRGLSISQVIDDLVLLTTCSDQAEWKLQVQFLPLR